jgi:L-threonylcarbamoyladenylate synthase
MSDASQFKPNSIQDQIQHALELLKNGEVVGMPTETVYGLAARIDSQSGLQKIFSIKERPFFDPLIVHVSSVDQAKQCSLAWNELNQVLADSFWPGPLTMVVPKSENISDLITSGLSSVGLRWPKHSVACELIKMCGVPLAAPSANKFGRTSPTTSAHVREEFGSSVFVIESEASEVGIESTVLSVKKIDESFELSILRKGAIFQSHIDSTLKNRSLKYHWSEVIDKKESPGHMKHHYMPSVPLVICKNSHITYSELSRILTQKLQQMPDVVEGVKIIKPKGVVKKIEMLKLPDQPEQAARMLYSQLRSVSQRSPDALCFIQTSAQTGEMWESVFDRLYKAASLILD